MERSQSCYNTISSSQLGRLTLRQLQAERIVVCEDFALMGFQAV